MRRLRPVSPTVDAHVQRVVAAWPPLSDEQRVRVSSLLWPGNAAEEVPVDAPLKSAA